VLVFLSLRLILLPIPPLLLLPARTRRGFRRVLINRIELFPLKRLNLSRPLLLPTLPDFFSPNRKLPLFLSLSSYLNIQMRI
jgi:hypothetical protein